MMRLRLSIRSCLIASTIWAVPSVAAASPVDFDTQIIPVLTKSGCNAGACHGAAIGRGGFKLSLYGGDPAEDYSAIVRALEGRRVNLARPAESLLLRKPTEQSAHGGGQRFEADSPEAKRLLRWIAAGAVRGGKRRLTGFAVRSGIRKNSAVLEARRSEVGGRRSDDRKSIRNRTPEFLRIPLRATATFSDGTTQDVTGWTVFTPEDKSAVEVRQSFKETTATVRRRGEHTVIARFLDRVVPVRLTVPLSDASVDHSKQPRRSFIDDEILKKLTNLRLPVSHEAADAQFLRRVSLDLTGRLPTPKEIESFLADSAKDKRAQTIDRLLKSDAFTDYWTFQFAKLLRIRSAPKDSQGALTYHRWLRERIKRGTGYDRIARTLLAATGDSHAYGPANFYRTTPDAREQAEFVSELFMGARLRCANCHNHPLDQWTQDDYHGFAAIFAKVKTGRVISIGPSGEVTHPRTGEPAVPRIPGVRFLTVKNPKSEIRNPKQFQNTKFESGKRARHRRFEHSDFEFVSDFEIRASDLRPDGRVEFAKWLTAPGNPYFAKAIVNRLWKAMMGRGLVEPADDLRTTNPATHPELLNRLATDFEKHGYDLRHTLSMIANSAAYARGVSDSSLRTNQGNAIIQSDDRYYSRRIVRELEPELLVDAVCDVTGVSEKFGDTKPGTRAVNLVDSRTASKTLDTLGRCDRNASCESGGTTGGGLTAKLHWINGPFLNQKISSKTGRLHQLLTAGKPNREIVTEFYQRALGRKPNAKELTFWQQQLGKSKTAADRQQAVEDFLWSLLSCREFRSN